MKGASKSLLSLFHSHKTLFHAKLTTTVESLPFPILRPLSTSASKTTSTSKPTTTSEKDQASTKPNKDSFILEKFRQRKLQGSLKNTTISTSQEGKPPSSRVVEKAIKSEGGLENDEGQSGGPTQVVSSFEELGLKEEVIEPAGEMGVWVPSEIQCVGIPAVLEGKSVVLSSDSGSGRTLAYLLPLLQLLRQDAALSSVKPKHPRAIVLCTTEELCDEVFRIAKFISNFARSKAARESGSGQLCPEDVPDDQIGMLVGTPDEVLEQIEEGSVIVDYIKYLVLDEADTMFDNGFGPEISKIVSPLRNHKSETNGQRFQTVLIASTIMKILGKNFSSFMEGLERDNAGKVTAMLLEMDHMEVLDIIKSPDALKKKVAEAVDSLTSGS